MHHHLPSDLGAGHVGGRRDDSERGQRAGDIAGVDEKAIQRTGRERGQRARVLDECVADTQGNAVAEMDGLREQVLALRGGSRDREPPSPPTLHFQWHRRLKYSGLAAPGHRHRHDRATGEPSSGAGDHIRHEVAALLPDAPLVLQRPLAAAGRRSQRLGGTLRLSLGQRTVSFAAERKPRSQGVGGRAEDDCADHDRGPVLVDQA